MLSEAHLFVNFGNLLGHLDIPAGVLSVELLTALALLGFFQLIVKRRLVWFRRSQETNRHQRQTKNESSPLSQSISHQLTEIGNRCSECGRCVRDCAFLTHYGTPRAIIESHDFTQSTAQAMAYECSLCGLCAAVCPEQLDPGRIFLELRRAYVSNGFFKASIYRTILSYENRGRSKLFSWQGIPEGCDTVFFPGCNLPGSRMTTTLRLFESLRRSIPKLGMVLNCCCKPSHDLGRQAHFNAAFGELRQALQRQGIRRVLVACPNCYKIFKEYGEGLMVQTVYEVLVENIAPVQLAHRWGTVSVHDPCAMRDNDTVQQSVRQLVAGLGMKHVEMRHRGRHTLCCGEGGTVHAVCPSFSKNWANLRAQESHDRIVITYCAGCCSFLGRVAPTVHIADLLYLPEAPQLGRKNTATRAPLSYLQRIRVKRRLKKAYSLSRPENAQHTP